MPGEEKRIPDLGGAGQEVSVPAPGKESIVKDKTGPVRLTMAEAFNLSFYLLPIFSILVVLVLSFLFLKPKAAQIGEINRKLESERKTLSALSQKLAALEGLSLPVIKSRTEQALKALPSEGNVPGVMATIRGISRDAGLSLDSLEIDPGHQSSASTKQAAGEKIQSLDLTVSLSGNEDRIRTFLDEINTVAPLTRILELNLSRSSPDVGKIELVMKSYFLPLPETIGKVEEPVPLLSAQEEDIYRKISILSLRLGVAGDTISVPSGKADPFSP